MKLKKILIKITLRLGFTLLRVPKLKRFIFNNSKNPIYVEFIGASGVGKSTLYRQVNKGFIKKWIDIRHFEELNFEKEKYLFEELPCYYNDLAKGRIDVVLEGDEVYAEKLNAVRTGYNILKRDALLHIYNKNDIVMSDEGILQFFLNGVQNLCKNKNSEFIKFIKNRAVIFCYAQPEIVVERISKRNEEKNHLWFKHKGRSFDELYKIVSESQNKIEDLVLELEKFVPVLRIDTTEPLKTNQYKINSFIKEIS